LVSIGLNVPPGGAPRGTAPFGAAGGAAWVLVAAALLEPAVNTVAPMAPPAMVEATSAAARTRVRMVFTGFTSVWLSSVIRGCGESRSRE
jgi:hypothetical protein